MEKWRSQLSYVLKPQFDHGQTGEGPVDSDSDSDSVG
jgi:hypothetical protein